MNPLGKIKCFVGRFPQDGRIDGDNEYSTRDPNTRIYVQLYSDAFRKLVDILDIFQVSDGTVSQSVSQFEMILEWCEWFDGIIKFKVC